MKNLISNIIQISNPQSIEVGEDFVSLDFQINPEMIFTDNMPGDIIALIKSADKIDFRGNELLGHIGRKCVFSAHAHFWSAEDLKENARYMQETKRKLPHYYIESIGGNLNGKNYQWNNQIF